MVQTFRVVQCFNCFTFQVDIVKKAKKWTCKMCNEQQSLKKVYFSGSSQECREHVQASNKNSINLSNQLLDELPEFNETPQPVKLEASSSNTKGDLVPNKSCTNKYDQFFEDGDDDVFQGLADVEKNFVDHKQSKFNSFLSNEDSGIAENPAASKNQRESLKLNDKSWNSVSSSIGSTNSVSKNNLNDRSSSSFTSNFTANSKPPFNSNKSSFSSYSGNNYNSNNNSQRNTNKFSNKPSFNSKNTATNPSPGSSYKTTYNKPSYSNNSGNSYKGKSNYSSYNRAPVPLSLVDFHKNAAKKPFEIKENSNFKKIPASGGSKIQNSETFSNNKVFRIPEAVSNPVGLLNNNQICGKPETVSSSSTQSSGTFQFKVSAQYCDSRNSGVMKTLEEFAGSGFKSNLPMSHKFLETPRNPVQSLSILQNPGKNQNILPDSQNNQTDNQKNPDDPQKINYGNSQFKFKATSTQIKRQTDATVSSPSKKSKWGHFQESFDDFEDFNFNESDLRQLERS